MKYLLTFSYDGSLFNGFQRQKNVKTVQKTLEDSLSKLLLEPIVIKGAGRTDAKVHALGQTAHFETLKKITRNFKRNLNQDLNGDIVVKKLKRVKENFHARFMVKEKIYRYIINRDRSSKESSYYFKSLYSLDMDLMREAAKELEGKHDFHNFVSGDRDDYISYIKQIKIKKKRNYIIMEFKGVGFYRYMVRHLAGAIYDVGRGKTSIDDIKKMLDYPHIPRQLSVLPAQGLYLVKVKY